MAKQNASAKYASAAEADKAFERASNHSRHTRFEAPPIDVNHVLVAHYDSTPAVQMTAAELWDNEVKKSRDPETFIPGVVRASTVWGDRTLADGAETFVRMSQQRAWMAPLDFGPVLERVYLDHHARRATFFGVREAEREEAIHRIEPRQPLFHVQHAVGGSDAAPLNLWRIVHITAGEDPGILDRFGAFADTRRLPEFITIYLARERNVELQMR